MTSTAEYRIMVYHLLSETLKEPTTQFVAELPELSIILKEALDGLGYSIPLAYYQNWPKLAGDLQGLTRSYYNSFFYPSDNRVVPVESIYRQWTFDETAEVPFAKEKGYLMSDAALHMKALYSQMGLVIPEEYQSSPDHLCLELEFAALLLEQDKLDWYRTFLTDHLTWVEELHHEAITNQIDPFYRDVIAIIKEFIAWEQKKIG